MLEICKYHLRALPHFEKKISIFFLQGTKKEYFQIYDSCEKLTHNFRLLHLNFKPKPDTSCYVQNAVFVAWPPGRRVKLHTPVSGLFYSQSPFAAVLYLVSKVKKPASQVQIISSRKEINMILTPSDRKMNKWDK